MANFHWRQNVRSSPASALPVYLGTEKPKIKTGKQSPIYPRSFPWEPQPRTFGRLSRGNRLNGGPIFSKTVADVSGGGGNPELIDDPTLVDDTDWVLTNMTHSGTGFFVTDTAGIPWDCEYQGVTLSSGTTYDVEMELENVTAGNQIDIALHNGSDLGISPDPANGTNSWSITPATTGFFVFKVKTGTVRPLASAKVTNISIVEQ